MGKNDWTMADLDALAAANPDISVDVQVGEMAIQRIDPAWTQTEIDFANEYLEPRLASAHSLTWMPQVEFRLPFMTYTADFVEWTVDGTTNIYEIKGEYRLGSADRSSLAVRALRWFVKSDLFNVMRVTRKGDDWKFELITNKRENGPHTRAKVDDENTN